MAKHSYSGIKAFETWRPVPGYEGLYEASSRGAVRRVAGEVALPTRWGTPAVRIVHGHRMATTLDAAGYLQVRLCKDGRAKTFRLARVVLAAFTGRFYALEAGHKNNKPTDNRIANLLWQTRVENEAHKTQTGRRPKSTVPSFSPRAVRAVRSMRKAGFLLQEMAALFGCHYSTLGLVCTNKTWRKNGQA